MNRSLHHHSIPAIVDTRCNSKFMSVHGHIDTHLSVYAQCMNYSRISLCMLATLLNQLADKNHHTEFLQEVECEVAPVEGCTDMPLILLT